MLVAIKHDGPLPVELVDEAEQSDYFQRQFDLYVRGLHESMPQPRLKELQLRELLEKIVGERDESLWTIPWKAPNKLTMEGPDPVGLPIFMNEPPAPQASAKFVVNEWNVDEHLWRRDPLRPFTWVAELQGVRFLIDDVMITCLGKKHPWEFLYDCRTGRPTRATVSR